MKYRSSISYSIPNLTLIFIVVVFVFDKVRCDVDNVNENANDTVFLTIRTNLKETTKKLYKLLKLSDRFYQMERITLVSALHNDLEQALKNDSMFFENVAHASKSDIHKDRANRFFKLTEIVDNIVNTAVKNEDRKEITLNEQKDSSVETEMLKLLKDIVDKVFTIEDIIGPFNKTFEKNIISTAKGVLKTKKTYNLKKWRSSSPHSSEVAMRKDGRRVFRGRETNINSYPFIVSVHIFGEFMCAGSIVSKDLIITAASCLQSAPRKQALRSDPNEMAVRVGSSFSHRGGNLVPITNVYMHPNYDPRLLMNNLAVARIARFHFHKRQLKIRRIEFAKRTTEAITDVTILGWGDKENQDIEDQGSLSVTRLEVFDLELCKKMYSRNFVGDKHFCAGFSNGSGGDCNRDMGGPAIVNNTLVGVINFGPPVCGDPNAPTVFTSVHEYAGWIETVIKKKHTNQVKNFPKKILYDHTISNKTLFEVTRPENYHEKLKPLNQANVLEQYPHAMLFLTSLVSGMLSKLSTASRQIKKLGLTRNNLQEYKTNPQEIMQVFLNNPRALKAFSSVVRGWISTDTRRTGRNSAFADNNGQFGDYDVLFTTTTQRLIQDLKPQLNPGKDTESGAPEEEIPGMSEQQLALLHKNTGDKQKQIDWEKTTRDPQEVQWMQQKNLHSTSVTGNTPSVILEILGRYPEFERPHLHEDYVKELEQIDRIVAQLYQPKELRKQIIRENQILKQQKLRYNLKDKDQRQKFADSQLYNEDRLGIGNMEVHETMDHKQKKGVEFELGDYMSLFVRNNKYSTTTVTRKTSKEKHILNENFGKLHTVALDDPKYAEDDETRAVIQQKPATPSPEYGFEYDQKGDKTSDDEKKKKKLAEYFYY